MFPFITESTHSRSVSPGQLQALLSIFQQDSLTGMAQLAQPNSKGDFWTLVYIDGQPVSLYRYSAKNYTRHDEKNWKSILSGKDMELATYQFSPRFIRPLHGIFEATLAKPGKVIKTQEIAKSMEDLEKSPEPLLAHFHWPSADGFVLVPGSGFGSRETLFWSAENATVTANFARWTEPECILTTYQGNSDSRAWRETYLIMGMDLLFSKTFERYNDLVGSGLTNRLEEHLNNVAKMQHWKISFTAGKLTDTHFFSSISDMRIAYKTLFMSAQRHIGAVVGENLFKESVERSLLLLPFALKTTLESENIFTTKK